MQCQLLIHQTNFTEGNRILLLQLFVGNFQLTFITSEENKMFHFCLASFSHNAQLQYNSTVALCFLNNIFYTVAALEILLFKKAASSIENTQLPKRFNSLIEKISNGFLKNYQDIAGLVFHWKRTFKSMFCWRSFVFFTITIPRNDSI